ncbi:MAG: TonB-dependent receptor, partial [Ignavibacteriaceae bacterium]
MNLKKLLLALIFSGISFAQTGSLKGKVTDGKSPIPFVNVIILDTGIGVGSDTNGYYVIRGIPTGEYKVRFTAVGWESQIFDVAILTDRTLELNVVLIEKAIEVGTVEVTGSHIQDKRDTRTSLIDLEPRSAKILPGAAEDVFRTLQSLPGVLAPNDFSSQLIVRGSGPDQNLIIIDDIEVFNPYRLYGVVSMFNPDAVAGVNLVTGGFPAKYGDRLSAVLDVTNREGITSKGFGGSLNASIVSANLVLEGRNPFGLHGSWLFNSRRTYYDLIIEPFVKSAGLVDNNTTFPNFYDFQGKLVIGPYAGHKFIFSGIISRDGVDVVSGEERNTPDSIGVYNVTHNDLAGISWHYSPNKNFLNKFVVSYYKNNGTTDFDSQILDPSINRNSFENSVPDTLAPYLLALSFNATFSYSKYSVDDKISYLVGDHIIDAGVGADFMETVIDFSFDLDPQLEALFAANPQFRSVLTDLKDVKFYNKYHTYLQDNFKVTENFFLQPSIRLDYYDILEKAYLAPRISLSYAIDD